MAMPWKTSVLTEERQRFVELAMRRKDSLSELARLFGISRKTGHKWLSRFALEHSPEWSRDRSRRPHASPGSTDERVVDALVELRRKHPTWGARKLLHLLAHAKPEMRLPAASTATELLKKRGLVRRRRRAAGTTRVPVQRPRAAADVPNEVWCVDFKGEFKLQNGEWCWPLTVTDAATRYLIACLAMPRISMERTIAAFEWIFAMYGLPMAILTDNGNPFSSSRSVWGLTQLSARWVRYGVGVERSRPSKPQDNGRHERFHRTLKESTAMPPAYSMAAQQRRFDRFQREYNEVRPHEAIGMKTPADLYFPSLQPKPAATAQPKYPDHFYPCSAATLGGICIEKQRFYVGRWAANELLGLEEIPGGRFRVHLADTVLGELHMDTGLITYGAPGAGSAPTRAGFSMHKAAA